MTPEERGEEIYLSVEGSELDRLAVVGLMTAIEAPEIATQVSSLKPDSKMIFMMAYECCMMWATKVGMESVLQPEIVQSSIRTMRDYIIKHGWYQAGAFEKIWAEIQTLMPLAMRSEPGGPPSYPVVEMLMAPNLAGFPLDVKIGSDMRFGFFVAMMINYLTDTSRITAQECRG